MGSITTRDQIADDDLALRRTIKFAVRATVASAVLLAVPVVLGSHRPNTDQLRLLVYTMPQILGLAVPAGFIVGVFAGLHGRRVSNRLTAVVLVTAAACSAASFGMSGWAIPVSERAYRVVVTGHANSTADLTEHELTLPELRQRLQVYTAEGRSTRNLAVHYHTRGAIACAQLVLTILALSLLSRVVMGGTIVWVIAACVVCAAYGLVSSAGVAAGRDGTLPAAVAAWLPNAAFLALSGVVGFVKRTALSRPANHSSAQR